MKKFVFALAMFLLAGAVNAQTENQPENNDIFLIVGQMPEFPGGYTEMNKFIAQNIKYPEAAYANGEHGTVYIRFIVEKDGSLSNIETLRGAGLELDAEAKRVVGLMPKFEPGKQNNKPVRVSMAIPIRFTINQPSEEESDK